jgi:hypothetical protein
LDEIVSDEREEASKIPERDLGSEILVGIEEINAQETGLIKIKALELQAPLRVYTANIFIESIKL